MNRQQAAGVGADGLVRESELADEAHGGSSTMSRFHPNDPPGSGADPSTDLLTLASQHLAGSHADADLIFAIANAMAHGTEALDRERAEHPGETVGDQFKRCWPLLQIHADRISTAVAELRGAAA
jgi:hypothetical protein